MQRSGINRRGGYRGRRPANGRYKSGRGGPVRSGPPEILSTPAFGHVFRFQTASSAQKPVTRAMLLNLMSMATTTTNQFRMIYAIKLKRVQIWGTPAAIGSAPNTVSVEWDGLNAPSALHSDTSVGVRSAYVSASPPRDASNRWWSVSGQNESETLFSIQASGPATVDVTVSLRLVDDEAAVAAESGTGAGSTVGTVYYHPLDGFTSNAYPASGGVRVLP